MAEEEASIFRDAIIRLCGVVIILLGIGMLAIGFLIANKFMQATGFMGIVVALVLYYYSRMMPGQRPPEEKPPEIRPSTR